MNKEQSEKYEYKIQKLEERLSEWEDYHEPLSRIFREVKKALPEAKKDASKRVEKFPESVLSGKEYIIWRLKAIDAEVSDEIDRLLTQMIEEIENDIGGM